MRICLNCGAIANGKNCTNCGSSKIKETSRHCENINCKKYNKPTALIEKYCSECGQPLAGGK
ncbi:MAG: hypothetical protein PHR82_09820 [Endomicrobiaceae bacterium]|nr:hypothetical protein [Endomicrobiaceae bacterium]